MPEKDRDQLDTSQLEFINVYSAARCLHDKKACRMIKNGPRYFQNSATIIFINISLPDMLRLEVSLNSGSIEC